MASFDFDQAEGLRRMLAGPKPRIVTFLSATAEDDKGAMLVNLGASLARAGNEVLIVDACEREYGVAQRLGVHGGPGLLQVARQECALNQVIRRVPQGFSVVNMNAGTRHTVVPAQAGTRHAVVPGQAGTRHTVVPAQAGARPTVVPAQAGTRPTVVPAQAGTRHTVVPAQEGTHAEFTQASTPRVAARSTSARTCTGMTAEDTRRLAKTFAVLVQQAGMVIVDGEFRDDGSFPVPLMAESEIVVQVSTSATSITNAYALIKRLSQQLGRRPFGILVTGATEAEAKVVYDNMALAATRYLAVKLTSMGSVPADEYLHRAARLGRAVVDAFPLAGASVAFRRLAGHFALPGMAQAGHPGGGAPFGS